MKVAIYARVSTANNGQAWLAGCRMLRGYQRLEGRRPELNRLMADAHKRKFAVVAVWEFDRFARSVSHLLRALETLKALGIAFASLTEQADTTTPAGKMVFTVLAAVAELERSLIVERVKAGFRNAKAKGKRLGRPRVVPDARRVAALREQGLSWAKIAERLGIGEGTVYRAAHAPAKISSSRRPVTHYGAVTN